MERLGPGLITLSVILILAGLAYLGWRSRLRRQQDIAPLPAIPAETDHPVEVYDGQYVVTTTAGDWLDRVAVHGLGIRTNALLRIYDHGILFERPGATDLYVPADCIKDIRSESGMIGKFVEKDGLAVVTWTLGETDVDTAFRTRSAADKAPLLARLNSFVPNAAQDEE